MNDNSALNDIQFNNKRVVITGGTGGIGSAIIEHLIHVFNMEIFLASSPTSYEAANNLMIQYPNNIKGFVCIDLMRTDAPEIIMYHAMLAFSGEIQKIEYTSEQVDFDATSMRQLSQNAPDILINCAGMSKDALFIGMTKDNWHKHMQINLYTSFFLSQLALKYMLPRKWGRVISIGSVIGKVGNAGQVAYATSKAAIEGMTKSLALEVATKGITVNSVQPGFIDTNMTSYIQNKEKIMAGIMSKIPMQRLGNGHDVAIAVEYLIKSQYVTGTALEVSGGMCRF